MPARTLGSPILMAFLRALTFVGITDAIFYRLLPGPSGRESGLLQHVHASLNAAGNLSFHLAFFAVTIAVISTAYRALRHRIWPGGLNGFLALCMLCLTALGVSAFLIGGGAAFAVGFTLLALLITLLVAMHAFSTAGTASVHAFAVSYCGALVCSAVSTIARFTDLFAAFGLSGDLLSDKAVRAGELLLAAAGVISFMAFFDFNRGARRGRVDGLAFLLGALAATGFAVGCLLAPDRLGLLGLDAGAARVLMLSTALFLGTMTATASLLDPARRLQGYGLLMILLAGFPLRIAYQHMMVVLGSVLLFAPTPIEAATPLASGATPLPETSPTDITPVVNTGQETG